VVRRIFAIVIVVCAVWSVVSAPAALPVPQTDGDGENRDIDLKADLMGPVAPGDSAIFLVGNFAAQHNGAVITCDSAVRYSSDRMEFFGNVLINQYTTYIYGDRAEYDRLRNEARVYSDIIKVVDGDATLYTYEFVFDTRTNTGRFGMGGVLVNRDNLMEAQRGYYHADTKDLICVGAVQMRNEEYDMTGDSVVYNLATDHAYYFDRTNIWNSNGDYLYADRGEYEKADTLYKVTRNGYILTPNQEVWSDSIDYRRASAHAVLRRGIQIDDTEHKTLLFGDYGEYWREPGDALLTRRPSAVNYDPQQGDSLFMRADTMYLYTMLPGRPVPGVPREPELAAADTMEVAAADTEVPETRDAAGVETSAPGAEETFAGAGGDRGERMPQMRSDSERRRGVQSAADTERSGADSVATTESAMADAPAAEGAELADSTSVQRPEPTEAERKALLREAARKAKEEAKAARAAARKHRLDSIGEQRQAKLTARLLAQKEREEGRLERQRTRAAERLQLRRARALRKGRELPDSSRLEMLDGLLEDNLSARDSLQSVLADTTQRDSMTLIPVQADSADSAEEERAYRMVRAYRNVRTFRTDFQSVCDSLVAVGRDSTIHLYVDPVLWNESNQITSDVMDVYTARQQIERAEFIGAPMMVSEIDTVHYNQVAGKEMTAYFAQNRIFRNDVNGNAQTIYYMQESDSPEVGGVMTLESGNISFYIDGENRIYRIVYRNDVNWTAYPMDKIPEDMELFLKGFRWEADRRPDRSDVFDRRIRPSERARRERLPRPTFPIAERMELNRERFAELNGWVDRDDTVPPEAEEWMRSLGYTTGQPRPDGMKL